MQPPEQPGVILNRSYRQKLRSQPRYSLAVLSRQAGISKAHLSKIFSGKQLPSARHMERITARLPLGEKARNQLALAICFHSLPDEVSRAFFLASVRREEPVPFIRDSLEGKEAILHDWHTIAILDLMTLGGARPDLAWISRQLGISPQQASVSVSLLFRMGFLAEEDGLWRKTKKYLEFPTARSHPAVRRFHAQMIGRGLQALSAETSPFERRLITGLTVATTPEKLQHAQKLLSNVLAEAMSVLDCEEPTLLYQLNLQFFSLLAASEEK
jgi:uncharacterized protein (TIGR02147 family)